MFRIFFFIYSPNSFKPGSFLADLSILTYNGNFSCILIQGLPNKTNFSIAWFALYLIATLPPKEWPTKIGLFTFNLVNKRRWIKNLIPVFERDRELLDLLLFSE